jgi:hypothetical protein
LLCATLRTGRVIFHLMMRECGVCWSPLLICRENECAPTGAAHTPPGAGSWIFLWTVDCGGGRSTCEYCRMRLLPLDWGIEDRFRG